MMYHLKKKASQPEEWKEVCEIGFSQSLKSESLK